MTREEFAEKLKLKRPRWAKVDNDVLVDGILKRYPMYKERIDGLPEYQSSLNRQLVEQNNQPEEKVGFGKRLVQGIAKPFLRTGLAGYQALQGLGTIITGNVDKAKAGQTVDAGYFGKISPIGYEEGDVGEVGKEKSFAGFAKDILGTGAEIASTMYAPARGVGVAKTGIKEGIKRGVKLGMKEGAITGALSGTGMALADDERIGEVIKQGAVDGTFGTVFGGLLGALSGAASGAFGKAGKAMRKPKFDDIVDAIDDVAIKTGKIDYSPGGILKEAKKQAPKISFREKMVGLDPDVKKMIEQNPEKFLRYLDVTEARNQGSTIIVNGKREVVPGAMGYGRKQVESARDKLQEVLNDTGSDIGKFRDKISTIKASPEDVGRAVSVFEDELSKLNLAIKAGKVKRLSGQVKKASKNEIKLLQGLYNDLMTIKQSPTIKNIIDGRVVFDNNINFAKSAREASNLLDPISRKIRKELANVNSKIVGKDQSALLSEYSDLIQLLNELNKYVDSRSGGEYLLRVALSGRGESSMNLLNTLHKYTGDDLLEDAYFSTIATDLIGNSRQKNLFRQEIQKAGLDAKAVIDALSGRNKLGAIGTVLKVGSDKVFKPEKIFRETAKKALKKTK